MAKVYKNQALTLDISFTDEDGDIINITGGTVEVELYAPGVTGTATETVSGSVSDGAAGTATATVTADTLDTIGEWKPQAHVTLSGTRWPAEVDSIVVIEKGSKG